MQSESEMPSSRDENEFAAAANLEIVEEQKVIECYEALESAEEKLGLEFGQAVIELREKIRENKSGDWMERLERLGISYAKARYWMAKVEGKPTQRVKATKAQEPLSWDVVLAKLRPLVDEIEILRRRRLVGASILQEPLTKALELVTSGGGNA